MKLRSSNSKFLIKASAFIFAIVVLFACTAPYQAPVDELGGNASNTARIRTSGTNGQSHKVNSGETLYAIAFQYDLEYSALARANDISAPYVIYPGQELTLNTTSQTSSSPAQSSQTSTSISRRPIEASGPSTSSTRTVSTPPAVSNASLRWSWPASGSVIAKFSNTGTENKGIDIGGKEGDDIFAAEAGEVVYAGSGLLRYGDLLIIKHNAQYLSAYAHNSRLLVTEGDEVKRGQKIAALGSTGIDREMLHFEIRQNGKPVDPAKYLPSR